MIGRWSVAKMQVRIVSRQTAHPLSSVLQEKHLAAFGPNAPNSPLRGLDPEYGPLEDRERVKRVVREVYDDVKGQDIKALVDALGRPFDQLWFRGGRLDRRCLCHGEGDVRRGR